MSWVFLVFVFRGPDSVCFSRQQRNCLTLTHLVTSVEQLKSSANCLTPDGDTFLLFHNSQITIIIDPADCKRSVRSSSCKQLYWYAGSYGG